MGRLLQVKALHENLQSAQVSLKNLLIHMNVQCNLKTLAIEIYLYMFKSHLCTGLDKGIDSSSSGKPMAQTDTHFHKVGMFE